MSSTQPFTFTVRGTPDPLRVHAMRGREALSAPYRFALDVVLSRATDTHAFLGADALLSVFVHGRERHVAGIIERVKRGDALADGDDSTVHVRLVPRLRRLALRRHSRVFQDATTSTIVSRVCGEHGALVRADLVEKLPKREICIQHVGRVGAVYAPRCDVWDGRRRLQRRDVRSDPGP